MDENCCQIAKLTLAESGDSHKNKPKLSFGIIADVQYADLPNGRNYQNTRTRYYRNALSQLQDAVLHWNSRGNVSFIIQLGDVIDGLNKRHKTSDKAFKEVCSEFEKFNGPVYHVLGNHDFYNFSRSYLINSSLFDPTLIDLPIENCACFEISPFKGYRFFFLDQYSFSLLGYEESGDNYKNAKSYLSGRNKNNDMNSPVGLHGVNKRFLQFNGAVDELQLIWFDEMLSRAEAKDEKVIVFGHLPVYKPSSCNMCLCWNYDKVLDILHKYSCVLAYCCGHDHDGGAAVDDKGIQHITFEGVVETSPRQQSFATVDIYEDKICFVGSGRTPDYIIKL